MTEAIRKFDWPGRLKAMGAHLLISLTLAAALAALVMLVWYPWPYSVLAGGRGLFWLVVSVDVILGPVLTFVAFNTAKPRAELVRDLACIAAVQLAALGYGLHTVYEVRPVAFVFEVDRFRLVGAADVRRQELPQARAAYRHLSLRGPLLLAARESNPGDERLQTIKLALQGYDVGTRPSYWVPYDSQLKRVLASARPVTLLYRQKPETAAELDGQLAAMGVDKASARFLPITARVQDWSVILKADGSIAGFLPRDGFF
ncbi:MAG: pilus assembly protein [Aquabacterium sp.]|nr:MAG: pilus assembly protein [Aquabacterium sp.]